MLHSSMSMSEKLCFNYLISFNLERRCCHHCRTLFQGSSQGRLMVTPTTIFPWTKLLKVQNPPLELAKQFLASSLKIYYLKHTWQKFTKIFKASSHLSQTPKMQTAHTMTNTPTLFREEFLKPNSIQKPQSKTPSITAFLGHEEGLLIRIHLLQV